MSAVLISLCVSAIALASTLTLNVEHEGDLYDMLETLSVDKDAVTELILTGKINDSDLGDAMDGFSTPIKGVIYPSINV